MGGRSYLMGITDATEGYDEAVAFIDRKAPDEAVDDGHDVHFSYMMMGSRVYIEDNADFAAFLALPGATRMKTVIDASIVNTGMPSSAPTYTEPPTAAPSFAPTSISCIGVLGYGGDGHGIYTLYQKRVKLWGGHGNYRQGLGMRQQTDAIYTMIAPGHWNTAAIKENGGLEVFGNRNNLYNQRPQTGNYWWIQIGNGWGCLINEENRLKCVGDNHNSVVSQSNTYTSDDVLAIGAGGYHMLIINEEGKMTCKGRNDQGQCNIQENEDYEEVYAGHLFTVGIKTDRTPRCWGQNNGGQISNCPKTTKFKFVSCGGYHCCGLLLNDDLKCWGYNGHREVTNAPQSGKFVSLVCQHHGSCAIRKDNDYKPICWGLNNGNYYPNGGDQTQFYAAKFPCQMPGEDDESED